MATEKEIEQRMSRLLKGKPINKQPEAPMGIEEKIDLIREAMWRLNELWPILNSPTTEALHRTLCVAMANLSRVSMALEREQQEIEETADAACPADCPACAAEAATNDSPGELYNRE